MLTSMTGRINRPTLRDNLLLKRSSKHAYFINNITMHNSHKSWVMCLPESYNLLTVSFISFVVTSSSSSSSYMNRKYAANFSARNVKTEPYIFKQTFPHSSANVTAWVLSFYWYWLVSGSLSTCRYKFKWSLMSTAMFVVWSTSLFGSFCSLTRTSSNGNRENVTSAVHSLILRFHALSSGGQHQIVYK